MLTVDGVEVGKRSVDYHGVDVHFMEGDEFGKLFVEKQIVWENEQIANGSPPFKIGDKVWIESVNNGRTDERDLKLYRKIQTVSDVTPMPVNGGVEWWISLRNVDYMFMPENLKLA